MATNVTGLISGVERGINIINRDRSLNQRSRALDIHEKGQEAKQLMEAYKLEQREKERAQREKLGALNADIRLFNSENTPDSLKVDLLNRITVSMGMGGGYSVDDINKVAPLMKKAQRNIDDFFANRQDRRTTINNLSVITAEGKQAGAELPVVNERIKQFEQDSLSQDIRDLFAIITKGRSGKKLARQEVERKNQIFINDSRRMKDQRAGDIVPTMIASGASPVQRIMGGEQPTIEKVAELEALAQQGDAGAQQRIESMRAFKRPTPEEERVRSLAKETGKQIGQEMGELQVEAVSANQGLKRLDKMKELVNTDKVTGIGGQVLRGVAAWVDTLSRSRFADSLGITEEQVRSANDAQLFTLLGRFIVGPLRLEIIGPGPVTDVEQAILDRMALGGGVGKKAALEMLEIYREQAMMKIDIYNMRRNSAIKLDHSIGDIYLPLTAGEEQALPVQQPAQTQMGLPQLPKPSSNAVKEADAIFEE